MGQGLGKLEVVSLREAWLNEASDFTPWLAKEENLALLGETLGIEFELTAQEQSVGAFSADILCKDTANGETVLIENQLEKTDHIHLGQIITYAAGLDARTVVWISGKFREEHRAAIDWLNENTVEELQFFGVEVELLRIGDSPMAPRFNLVSKPNDWTKSVSEAAHTINHNPLTETKLQQQRYWAALAEYIAESGSSIRPQKPLPQHWTNFSVGRNGMNLAATVNSREDRIGIELCLTSELAKEHFRELEKFRPQIEAALGSDIDWSELPGRKSARIAVYRSEADPTDELKWREQHVWLTEALEKFNRVFRPLVRELP